MSHSCYGNAEQLARSHKRGRIISKEQWAVCRIVQYDYQSGRTS